MRKLISWLLLISLVCSCGCALAAENPRYLPILMNRLYTSSAEALETDDSRTVSTACAVLDYALTMTDPSAYAMSFTGDYYIFGDGAVPGDTLLICCPLEANASGMLSGVIIYNMDGQQYSWSTSTATVEDRVEYLSQQAYPYYAVDGSNVAIAAKELIDYFFAK